MEFDNDRKIHPAYKTEIVFWIMLVLLCPVISLFSNFWFLPAFFIALLFISLLLFPAYLLYAKFIVPNFLFERKYVWFTVLSTGVFFFIQLFTVGIHQFILQFSLRPQEEFYLLYAPRTLFRDGMWTLVNMFLCLTFAHYKKSIDEHELIINLQKDNTLYRLKYLQSQLNPHFLFNTLNSIYSLSLQKSDQAPDVIIKLADIMRYLIYECNEQKIPLNKEIEFIENYIEIEKIRYKAEVKFTVEGNTEGVMIE
ncbi:MAG: histidine kinase, partial [Bacteroidetes bacterium]|nr:histidine kinase [Bacteroidota bacterium]